MNHMDEQTKLVHARLEEWARWARDNGIAGFPSQSNTENAAKYGKQISTKGEEHMPERVANVDSAVCSLGDIDGRVVRIYYREWQPRLVMARKVHMREKQFDIVLNRARCRIAGFLAAVEKKV